MKEMGFWSNGKDLSPLPWLNNEKDNNSVAPIPSSWDQLFAAFQVTFKMRRVIKSGVTDINLHGWWNNRCKVKWKNGKKA